MKKYIHRLLCITFLLLSGLTVFNCHSQTNADRQHRQERGFDHQQQRDDTRTKKSRFSDAQRIPAKVYDVLQYVRTHRNAPEGYVGGRRFGNYEGHLPRRDLSGEEIRYQEWDVNPKQKGRNRGAERLVTGSDGRAWYTRDHYNSFVEVK